MHLIRDIDVAVGVAKRWGMLKADRWGMNKWKMELDVCVYDTQVSDTDENMPFHFMFADNLDDAMKMLFDLSNRGYEIFQTCGHTGIVSFLVQPSVDHSTNIDIYVLDRISTLFK
jgi:hypothetical protein